MVTGGGGFLGTHVVNLLNKKGFNNLFIPRQKDYDLTKESNVEKLYSDSKPDSEFKADQYFMGYTAKIRSAVLFKE